MNSHLIIVADRGQLRAYRRLRNSPSRSPHLELIAEQEPSAPHEKMSDHVTDQAGRFPGGGGAGGISGDLSGGEQLHQQAEQDHRVLEQLAAKIDTLLADDGVTDCLLAISAPIHKQLVDLLASKSREKIKQVLASNLVKTDPTELLGHFEKATMLGARTW